MLYYALVFLVIGLIAGQRESAHAAQQLGK